MYNRSSEQNANLVLNRPTPIRALATSLHFSCFLGHFNIGPSPQFLEKIMHAFYKTKFSKSNKFVFWVRRAWE